nr:MAG TPA: hypothetical protein [Caudoviricetes sp.]
MALLFGHPYHLPHLDYVNIVTHTASFVNTFSRKNIDFVSF